MEYLISKLYLPRFNHLGFLFAQSPTNNTSTKTQTEVDANANAYGNDIRSEVPTKQSDSKTLTTDNTSTKITLRDAVTEILRLPTEIQTQVNADALNNAFVDFLGADASVKGQVYTQAAQSAVQAIDQISSMPEVSAEVKAKLTELKQDVVESGGNNVKHVLPFNSNKSSGEVRKDYKKTFFKAYPELEGSVIVHHAIEQQVLKRYKGLFSEVEIHALENLRGIPKDINNSLHLSKLRKEWNKFYREYPNPAKQEVIAYMINLDEKYGHLFNPHVK